MEYPTRRWKSDCLGSLLYGCVKTAETWQQYRAASFGQPWGSLAVRGESPAAFDRPGIPPGGVAPRSDILDILRSSRLASRAPGRSRCDAGLSPRTASPLET